MVSVEPPTASNEHHLQVCRSEPVDVGVFFWDLSVYHTPRAVFRVFATRERDWSYLQESGELTASRPKQHGRVRGCILHTAESRVRVTRQARGGRDVRLKCKTII